MGINGIVPALALVAGCYFAGSILIPISLAFFFAILLDKAVVWGERRGIRRSLSSPVVVAAFLLVAVAAGWASYTSFIRIAVEVPRYSEKIRNTVRGLQKRTELLVHRTDTLMPAQIPHDDVQKVQVVDGGDSTTKAVFHGIGSVFEAISIAVFVPLLLLSFLLSKASLMRSFTAVLEKNCDVRMITTELKQMVKAFFVGNLAVAMVLAVIQGCVFSIIGLHNAFPLGVLSGFLNIVPLVGSLLALALPVAQGLLQYNEAAPFVVICGSLLSLHLVVGNIVIPQLVGARVNLNSAAITLGLLFWGWLWGGFGFLLAIPMTALVKIVLETRPETVGLANLLAATPQETATSELLLFNRLMARFFSGGPRAVPRKSELPEPKTIP